MLPSATGYSAPADSSSCDCGDCDTCSDGGGWWWMVQPQGCGLLGVVLIAGEHSCEFSGRDFTYGFGSWF